MMCSGATTMPGWYLGQVWYPLGKVWYPLGQEKEACGILLVNYILGSIMKEDTQNQPTMLSLKIEPS